MSNSMRGDVVVGYAVVTGEAVAIPLRHMAVTGQTQESGKTTTLEALVARSAGMTALAFVTKRGEQSFADARRIRPYFRDRADWQFVTSILDATLQEKNKFLRPWIMKICRTTKTLADVQAKVREELKTARGIHDGVYTQLDAYLDLIVPEIRRHPLAPKLDLVGGGLSVMDISTVSTPMQMLFVQSALDWINDYAGDTIVVIPEAWEFVPEGKGSPVKSSAVALVRKGAGLGNRIWVDSQDMAGVDKTILRGCAVWLIGVQREANEIKRNLANIPASIKRPTAAAVAQLERGEFYVCWATHAIKTYVQPAWMSAEEAIAHARGEPVAPARRATPPKRTPIQPEPGGGAPGVKRSLERPRNRAPKRPVATYDRFLAVRRAAKFVRMEARKDEKGAVKVEVGRAKFHFGEGAVVKWMRPSYLPEILDLVEDTGRRVSAICRLWYSDFIYEGGDVTQVRWRPFKGDDEQVIPIGERARAAIKRILAERPGIGNAPIFPSLRRPERSIGKRTATDWLLAAESIAFEKEWITEQHLEGGCFHPYRRKWATERKHLADKDVMLAGGWSDDRSLKTSYQHSDHATMLAVVNEPRKLREKQS